MTITLLFFAALRDLVGKEEEALALPAGVETIGELAACLEKRPELEGRLSSVRFALNEAFAEAGDRLTDGDTVALIPPVSGG